MVGYFNPTRGGDLVRVRDRVETADYVLVVRLEISSSIDEPRVLGDEGRRALQREPCGSFANPQILCT